MAGVTHDFECLAHGQFEARVKKGEKPKCPKGCGKSLVTLVFNRAPGVVSARTRTSDRLVKEMAAAQGLSDISTSPSRPGGSVMDRIRKKYGAHIKPEQMPRAVDAQQYLGAMTHRANELTNVGLGHKYESTQWQKDKESGKVRHVDVAHQDYLPPASVERVRDTPK